MAEKAQAKLALDPKKNAEGTMIVALLLTEVERFLDEGAYKLIVLAHRRRFEPSIQCTEGRCPYY